MSHYQIEWCYLSELPDVLGPFMYGDEAHCHFLIRFPDVPIGEDGHCEFFSVNIVTYAKAIALQLPPEGCRPYFIADSMTQEQFRQHVTGDLSRAFEHAPREQALHHLNQTYVWTSLDYHDEFRNDTTAANMVVAQIEQAFAGVSRGDGMTLHQALAVDDYAAPEVVEQARALDLDTDWHDVPKDVMATHCSFFSFLDAKGFRYYLPAAMLLAFDEKAQMLSVTGYRDLRQATYWSLLPTVAPRDIGKGLNLSFNSETFIVEHDFTDAQVRAIYAFLCYIAVEHEGVDEEQLHPMRAWRQSAKQRAGTLN
jgi:hypothetical protein